MSAFSALQHTFFLGIRHVAARGMGVITLLISAFLVDLTAFAPFGIYLSLGALGVLIVFLRYEVALFSASDPDLPGLIKLCVWIGTGMIILMVMVSGCIHIFYPLPFWFIAGFPCALMFRALLRLLIVRATRLEDAHGLGWVVIVQAIVQPLVLLMAVIFVSKQVSSLIIADLCGHAAAVIYLLRRQPDIFRFSKLTSLQNTFQKWHEFPLYNLPGALMSLSFALSPLLLVPLIANPVQAGQIAFLMRLFDVPTQMIPAILTPVLIKQLRLRNRKNESISTGELVTLLIFTGLFYVFIAFLLIFIEPFFPHSNLKGTYDFIWPVALFQAGIALAFPLMDAASLYNGQKQSLFIQIIFLSLIALVWLSGLTPLGFVICLAIVSLVRIAAIAFVLKRSMKPFPMG